MVKNKISYISFQRQKVIIKTGSKSDILYYPTTLRCYHEGHVKNNGFRNYNA